jgi:hypothetical protein
VTHIGAYPLIPVVFGAAAISGVRGSFWEMLAVLLGLSWNVLGSLVWLGIHSPLLPTVHMDSSLAETLVFILALMIVSLLNVRSAERRV